MKLCPIVMAGALALIPAAANSATWVQYDVYGAGEWWSQDYTSDPPWTNGRAAIHATMFVEIEQNGHEFSQIYSDDPIRYFWAEASDSLLSFNFDLIDGDCGHSYCENWQVNLTFAPGSFDTFPTKLPHLIGGDFAHSAGGHWLVTDTNGYVVGVSAKVVKDPGQSGMEVRQVPEPASWAMMLGGFGVIGGVMRGRGKPSVAFA